ncbi:MAG: GAF domain-containing protein [Bacteroidota bacterium]
MKNFYLILPDMPENKNYDAEFCGKLAIHQTNSVQDYGYLLVLDISSLEIIQCSENISEVISASARELVGQDLTAVFSAKEVDQLKLEIAKGERNRVPLKSVIRHADEELPFNILLHVQKQLVIIELEKADLQDERSFTEVFQEVRSFISIIERSDSLQEICQESIHEIRRLAGFDGIRMYRFDEDWNGTVIAEEIEGELESYLGQTFPASDVPRQARALYIKNPYRLIPNRSYTPFKLFPVLNPVTNGFIDLSDCNLRSVAAVHLEYMANMNVTASMSIRVMVAGELWGLISCHHITEKYLSVELRSIFEWLSMEISYRIAAVVKQQQLSRSAELLRIKSVITENIFAKGSIEKGLLEDENLLTLFKATGFAISLAGKITAAGLAPKTEDLDNLFLWLSGKGFGTIYSSHELGEVYEEAQSYKELVSGIMVIPIDPSKGDFVVCFRSEVIRDIKWGGDPNQAINFEKNGVNYHPRNSFKLWLQTVRGQSDPWSPEELEIAELLRAFLVDFRSGQLNF